MPDRPGLDDNEALKNLIAVWRDGSADIDSRLLSVYDRIRTELGSGTVNANTVNRLRIQADRLNELAGTAAAVTDDLVDSTRRFITDGHFDQIYASGARLSAPFSFSAPHRAAVNVLAQDLFDDVLVMTEFIDDDAKRFAREAGRRLTGFKLTSGTPAQTQARRLAAELRTEFQRRGMGAVVYRDGSRHGFGEYAEMLLRTKTGVAYNTGTLNQGRLAGIEFYELLDGSLCGLTSHNDGELANGMIVDYATAMAFPLSHPNCRRSTNPRPDLNRGNVGDAVSVQSDAARADQAAFEQALREQAQRRSSGRARRARRARPTRASRQAERAQRTAELERQRVRAARRDARRAEIAKAREILEEQKRFALLPPKAQELELIARRYGVTSDQIVAARPAAKAIKADLRELAAQEATEMNIFLNSNDLHQMRRPKRAVTRVDPRTGRRFTARESSGYDWFEQLTVSERNRVMHRMGADVSSSPDVLAEQVRRVTGQDWGDGEAMEWLLGHWLREDAMRSVSSGRNPNYWDIDTLFANDYENSGYKLSELFGVKPDEAAAHVARVQLDEAAIHANRMLGQAKLGPAPYELSMEEFVFQLDEVAEFLGSNIDPVLEVAARARLRELAPDEIDINGAMNPFELYEEIRIVAQTAGRI